MQNTSNRRSCTDRPIDGSEIPILLLATGALLLPVDVSAAKSFMTLCTTWTRSAVEVDLSLRVRSFKFPVSSKRHTKLSIPLYEIGFFFYRFGLIILPEPFNHQRPI